MSSYGGLFDSLPDVTSAFGLTIRFDWSGVPHPAGLLDNSPVDPKLDLVVHFLGTVRMNDEPARPPRYSNGTKTLRFRSEQSSEGPLLRFVSESPRGRIEFVLSHHARHMWVSWSQEAPQGEVLSLLFNSMLAWVLRFTGRTCLHASVVARNGLAIAFVAPSGIGKSTVAASLIERGYALMTDDAAALSLHDEQVLVQPGMPQLGLRDPSLEALPRFRAETSTVTDDKRRFELRATSAEYGLRFENRALPLSAIYFLRRSALARKPEIRPSKPAQSVVTLMGSLYPSSTSPLKHTKLADQLSQLSFVVQNVPCRHLVIPDALATLPLVNDYLIEDVVALQAA